MKTSKLALLLELVPFCYRYLNRISSLLAYLGANILAYANDIAYRTVRVYYVHIDDTAVEGFASISGIMGFDFSHEFG